MTPELPWKHSHEWSAAMLGPLATDCAGNAAYALAMSLAPNDVNLGNLLSGVATAASEKAYREGIAAGMKIATRIHHAEASTHTDRLTPDL